MTAPAAPTPDRCPRCAGTFACGAHASPPCACTTVTLSAELQARLRDQFEGCLCLSCLRELAGTPHGAAQSLTGATPPAPLPGPPTPAAAALTPEREAARLAARVAKDGAA